MDEAGGDVVGERPGDAAEVRAAGGEGRCGGAEVHCLHLDGLPAEVERPGEHTQRNRHGAPTTSRACAPWPVGVIGLRPSRAALDLEATLGVGLGLPANLQSAASGLFGLRCRSRRGDLSSQGPQVVDDRAREREPPPFEMLVGPVGGATTPRRRSRRRGDGAPTCHIIELTFGCSSGSSQRLRCVLIEADIGGRIPGRHRRLLRGFGAPAEAMTIAALRPIRDERRTRSMRATGAR